MGRTAITSVRRHGRSDWTQLYGRHVSAKLQQEAFKELRRSNEHPEYAEAELRWSDDGVEHHRTFRKSPTAAEKAAAEKSAAEAASQSQDITDPVSSEADTPSTPDASAELTGEDAPPTAAEPQSPAAPQPSAAPKKAAAKKVAHR